MAMLIDNKENYTLLHSGENSFEEFAQTFLKYSNNYTGKHLFLQLSENLNITEENILVFLDYAEQSQKNETTFVVIYSNVDVDKFPETFNIVPTLREAEDILEMENIQRDLGF